MIEDDLLREVRLHGIDYKYHGHYKPNRLRMQNEIVRRLMAQEDAPVHLKEGERNNTWVVFTAGPMGCGKTTCVKVPRSFLTPLDNLTFGSLTSSIPPAQGPA